MKKTTSIYILLILVLATPMLWAAQGELQAVQSGEGDPTMTAGHRRYSNCIEQISINLNFLRRFDTGVPKPEQSGLFLSADRHEIYLAGRRNVFVFQKLDQNSPNSNLSSLVCPIPNGQQNGQFFINYSNNKMLGGCIRGNLQNRNMTSLVELDSNTCPQVRSTCQNQPKHQRSSLSFLSSAMSNYLTKVCNINSAVKALPENSGVSNQIGNSTNDMLAACKMLPPFIRGSVTNEVAGGAYRNCREGKEIRRTTTARNPPRRPRRLGEPIEGHDIFELGPRGQEPNLEETVNRPQRSRLRNPEGGVSNNGGLEKRRHGVSAGP